MLFHVPYWEWAANILGIILAFLLSLPNGLLKRFEKYFSSEHLHRILTQEEIEKITLLIRNQESRTETELAEKDLGQIIDWLNQAKVIDKAVFPVTAEKTTLTIDTEEEKIEIQPYKEELIIQRSRQHDKPVSYWVKQPELRHWFESVNN